ncbi:Protein TSSC4 [Channa argus]|uniref:U5 small nuclear ribonucleoprotein TSSC4 n=1 Tax=Channa argus TaxID=215402 RepID=A0A6G1P9T5_CHAAH|nr:Protein TSSC4 [Channa argus]
MCDQKNDEDLNELSASDESEPEEQPSRAAFDPELDQDEEDDDDGGGGGGESGVSASFHQTSFSLRGGSSAFSDRSHSIFNCLDNITKVGSSSQKQEHTAHGEFIRPQPPQPSRKTTHPPSTGPTPPKKRGVPDYLVHPEHWTHYSLEDVTESSDQDNRRAAYQFLSSLQQEKQSNSEQSDIQQRMIFCRPTRQPKEQTADQLLPVSEKEKGMHLSHLEEEEGEEGSEREKIGERETERNEEKNKDKDQEEEETRAVGQSEKEKEKRAQREKGEDKEKMEQINPGFYSFRKAKSKIYRKSSKQDDN